MRQDAPVGVFDSGVGGLTVAREIMRQLPDEKIVYFGDTARVPYGSKSPDTIIRYVRQIVRFLKTKNVKFIVTACNTASAFALDTVAAEIDIPMIGVIRPGAKTAAETTRNGRIGVIATEGTIASGMYNRHILALRPDVEVYGKACPLFVHLVEAGWLNGDRITEEVATRYLAELKEKDVDTLILGCTHYPLIRKLIGDEMGSGVTLVNPAYETALDLKRRLDEEGLTAPHRDEPPAHEFYVSDGTEKFKAFAHSILTCDTSRTELIEIEKY